MKYDTLEATPFLYVQNVEDLAQLCAELAKASEIAIDLEHHN